MAEDETHGSKPEDQDHIIATPHTLVVSLSAANQRKAQSCLEKSGKITFSLKEVSVTKLPEARRGDSVEVD